MRNYTFDEIYEIIGELNEYLENYDAQYQLYLYLNDEVSMIEMENKYHRFWSHLNDFVIDEIYDAYHNNGIDAVENVIDEIRWNA